MTHSLSEYAGGLAQTSLDAYRIDPALHKRFNTKRGLRNEDGTGVLVGLTEIGEVHGYIIDDMERVPDTGHLFYRGYDVADLVEGFSSEGRRGYAEISYLLLTGELPSESELAAYRDVLGEARILPERFVEDAILSNPSRDIMNSLARAVLSLYAYDDDPDSQSIEAVFRQSIELIARFPVLAAYAYQAKRHYFDGDSLWLHGVGPDWGTAENFLAMIRPDRKYSELEALVLDLALVLHAEHGAGNNSAFTMHVVSSAATDTYSAVAAAIGSLKGAKHGGAAGRARGMMLDAQEQLSSWDAPSVRDHCRRLLRKEAYDRSGLIYGLGHAVYTLSDPRAVLLRRRAAELASELGFEREFALYEMVADIAPTVFQEERNTDQIIAPNVDFFSGFVYSMLGIPMELYTPLFAVARISGWAAHRLEEVNTGGRIIRPAYKAIKPRRPYPALRTRDPRRAD